MIRIALVIPEKEWKVILFVLLERARVVFWYLGSFLIKVSRMNVFWLKFSVILVLFGPSTCQFSRIFNIFPSFESVKNATSNLISYLPSLPSAPCVGHATLQAGKCFLKDDCVASGGRLDSGCLRSSQVCCVPTTRCGSVVITKDVEVSNQNYPLTDTSSIICQYTIKRADLLVAQLRVDFDILELGDPGTPDPCDGDHLVLQSANNPNIFNHVCGNNTGSHFVIDNWSETLTLKIILGKSSTQRKWLIRIRQLDTRSPLFAPQGCRQFYTESDGALKSVVTREPATYSACFKKHAGRCAIKFYHKSSVFRNSSATSGNELIDITSLSTASSALPVFNTLLEEQGVQGDDDLTSSVCQASMFFPPTETATGGYYWCMNQELFDGLTVVGDLWIVYIEQTSSTSSFHLPYSFTNC